MSTPTTTRSSRIGAALFALRINLFAISLSALWIPINLIVLPDRVDDLVPAFLRGSGLGLVTLLGVGTAALVQPIAGRITDGSRLPDRRKPFILAGSLIMSALIVALELAPAFLVLLGVYIVLQVTSNFAQAALQALIPDLVREEDRGTASGAKTGLDALGTVIGLAGAALLLSADEGHAGFIVFVLVVLLLGAAANLFNPRVPPVEEQEASQGAALSFDTIQAPFRQFFAATRDFRMAVLTRFFYSLGLFIVLRFLTFFLESRFGIDEPGNDISTHLLVGFVLAAAGAASAGVLSDALGRTTVLRISVIISAAMLVGLAIAPVFAVAGACGAVLALSSGAFQAANWALLSDTMDQKRGGEYYGLANLATAGAGAVAGAFGPLVDVLQAVSPDATYIALFHVAAAITLSSLLSIRSIHEKRPLTTRPASA